MIKIRSFVSVIFICSLFGCQVGQSATISTPITPTPTASSTSLPIPYPTLGPTDIAEFMIPQITRFSGVVFSDTGQPLSDVMVTARSVNPEVPYEDLATTDANGVYLFKNGPRGIAILLLASKQGYQTIEQNIVLKTAPSDDTSANRFDFGSADPSKSSSAPGLQAESKSE